VDFSRFSGIRKNENWSPSIKKSFIFLLYLLKPSVDNFDNGLANVTHTGLEDQMVDFIKNIKTFFQKNI
jgi:hypothetical protein